MSRLFETCILNLIKILNNTKLIKNYPENKNNQKSIELSVFSSNIVPEDKPIDDDYVMVSIEGKPIDDDYVMVDDEIEYTNNYSSIHEIIRI
jgi:hypothetical protein